MKPLIVGGNSGIGLAIAVSFIKRSAEKIYIVGKDFPDLSCLDDKTKNEFKKRVIFRKQNFVFFDASVFDGIEDVDALVITTGFGRLSLFEELNEIEIENLIKVNFDAIVRIIKRYYSKIANDCDFYTSVLVSICGQIVSPFFSVYGATKGGLRFLIENLNCELEAKGYKNRILDVSPGSIEGTAFNGGKNNVSQIEWLADEIIDRMLKREELFIPKYNEIYSNVIKKYLSNRMSFRKESYSYKEKSGRIATVPQVTIGYLSGTFDLFHIGHLNLLRRAKEQCDYLIVSVHNNGSWKGKETFIPYDERRAIVESIKYVDMVVDDCIEDCDAWDLYHYNKLFVGSDYKGTERFERYELLLKDKAEIVYFPYTKGTSSTQLREALKRK